MNEQQNEFRCITESWFDLLICTHPFFTSNFQVKKAEIELERKLQSKRDRLKGQLANEEQKYYTEINEKYKWHRETEMKEQCKGLERLRMERDADRQKYIETKQIQQQMYDSIVQVCLFLNRSIIFFFRINIKSFFVLNCQHLRNSRKW